MEQLDAPLTGWSDGGHGQAEQLDAPQTGWSDSGQVEQPDAPQTSGQVEQLDDLRTGWSDGGQAEQLDEAGVHESGWQHEEEEEPSTDLPSPPPIYEDISHTHSPIPDSKHYCKKFGKCLLGKQNSKGVEIRTAGGAKRGRANLDALLSYKIFGI